MRGVRHSVQFYSDIRRRRFIVEIRFNLASRVVGVVTSYFPVKQKQTKCP